MSVCVCDHTSILGINGDKPWGVLPRFWRDLPWKSVNSKQILHLLQGENSPETGVNCPTSHKLRAG